LLFPTLIKFKSKEEKKNFELQYHMFYEERVIDIPDGKPKWAGTAEDSDLIADSPPEDIKKRKRQVEKKNNGEQSGEDNGYSKDAKKKK